MKSNVANIFVLFIAVALILCGCKEEAKSEPNSKKIEFCEGTLLLHIGDQALLVPRTQKDPSLIITLEDRTELTSLHRAQPGYGCDVDEIKNVETVSWSRLRISAIKEGSDYKGFKGTYGDIEDKYLEEKKEGRVETLADGLEVINPEKVIYVLPKDEFPTLRGYPVAFGCSGIKEGPPPYIGGCDTRYAFSEGLIISYSFTFNKRNADEAIEVEKEQRAFLNNMLSAGNAALKNKNIIQGE